MHELTDSDSLALRLRDILRHRFGDEVSTDDLDRSSLAELLVKANHASQRRYRADRNVDFDLIRLLCAVALCSPTKSDLQQRDIIILENREQRQRITALLGEPWIDAAPSFLVFCGNNRRQRQLHQWHGRRFANDHLDAFFNAAVDAAIALAAFVAAAEAVGLGCCPISAIRDYAKDVSAVLELPAHVFPLAGLTLGWPVEQAQVSLRLPLALTVHRDRFDEASLRKGVVEYDRRRAEVQPYRRQRDQEEDGISDDYGWSKDKVLQYAKPLRADFGAFVRSKGFDLS